MSISSQSRFLTSVGLGLCVTILSGLSYLIYRRYKKREVIPSKWKQVGTLDELFIFPIKSCAPIELDEAFCENLVLRKGDIKDRSLMIIEKSGQLLTARTYPKMFKIVPRIVGRTKLVFSAPGMDDLHFDFSDLNDKSNRGVKALIYGFYVDALDCGELYHEWFSKYILEQPEGLRLVYYPHSTATRPVNKSYVEGIYTKKDTGTFQDMSSYHLINNNSVQELNSRLENPLSPSRFRANFNIKSTGQPFDEDHWQWIRIGNEATFRNIGPCFRCILPNINPYTAERDPDGEPLKTLKTYREIPGAKTKSPGMGIQIGLRVEGVIKRADYIFVEDLSS